MPGVNVYLKHLFLVFVLKNLKYWIFNIYLHLCIFVVYLNHLSIIVWYLCSFYCHIFIQWTHLVVIVALVINLVNQFSVFFRPFVFVICEIYLKIFYFSKSTNILGGMCNRMKLVILYWSNIDPFHHLHLLILI